MNKEQRSELIQRQRQELAVIREEVDRKIDNLQESLKVNEETFLQLLRLESESKTTLLNTIKSTLPHNEDVSIATNQIEETTQSFLQTHKDASSRIEQLLSNSISDFNRIKTDMLISVDVSLRSLEKRLTVFENKFVEMERIEQSLGTFKPDVIELHFTDGKQSIDKNILQTQRLEGSLLAKYLTAVEGEIIEPDEKKEESQKENEEVINEEHNEGESNEIVKKIQISRSQEFFKYVMNYITTGEVITGSVELIHLQAASTELRAYGISESNIYLSLRNSLITYFTTEKTSVEEVFAAMNLSQFTQLFSLQRACLSVNEEEKVLASKLLNCLTYIEAQQVLHGFVRSRLLTIEKIKNTTILQFITDSLQPKESIDFKVSNTNITSTGTVVSNRLHKQFNVAMIPEIVSAFTIRIIGAGRSGIGNAMYIGFSFASPSNPPSGQQWVRAGYYLSVYNGNLYSEKVTPTSANHVYYNKRITSEDVVICWYSRTERAIGFIINNVQLGPAFIGISQVDLYPTLVFYEADQAFAIDWVLPIQ
ncbi:Potassium channel tetramerization-type BTB domain-containing protein [Entamoeba marina]